jgi:hypothetical protein
LSCYKHYNYIEHCEHPKPVSVGMAVYGTNAYNSCYLRTTQYTSPDPLSASIVAMFTPLMLSYTRCNNYESDRTNWLARGGLTRFAEVLIL